MKHTVGLFVVLVSFVTAACAKVPQTTAEKQAAIEAAVRAAIPQAGVVVSEREVGKSLPDIVVRIELPDARQQLMTVRDSTGSLVVTAAGMHFLVTATREACEGIIKRRVSGPSEQSLTLEYRQMQAGWEIRLYVMTLPMSALQNHLSLVMALQYPRLVDDRPRFERRPPGHGRSG